MGTFDIGIDACDLDKTIVQCKLRKKILNYKECSTFFACQNSFNDETDYNNINYAIASEDSIAIEGFDLVKKYDSLYLFEKTD